MKSGRRCPPAVVVAVLLVACVARDHQPPALLNRSDNVPAALPANPDSLAFRLAVAPESLFAAGLELYYRDSFDSARHVWQVEARRASGKDSSSLGRTLMWLGLAQRHLGNLVEARRSEESALGVKQRFGQDAQISRSFNALGLVAWDQGRYREALAYFDSAEARAWQNGDSVGAVRAALNVPLVQVDLGDYAAARAGFEAALYQARALRNEQFQANALANLAMLEIRVGDPSAALPLLAQARALYQRLDYRVGEANALGQLATAWSALGDLQRAIALADSDLTLARSEGMVAEVAAILEIEADLHLQAGSPRLALLRLRDADSLDAAVGLPNERGNNLRRSATILLSMGEPSAAVERARAALALHDSLGARAEVVLDRLELAGALLAAGEPDRARQEADVGLREAESMGNPSLERRAAGVAAQVALDGGDPRLALRYASRAGAAQGISDWTLPSLRAGALLQLGHLPEARGEAQRAVAAVERERASLALGPLRSSYLQGRIEVFARLVQIQLALGDTAAAFETAAAVPGRGLLERLGQVSNPKGNIGGAADAERLLREAAEVEAELAALGSGLKDRGRVQPLTRRLSALRSVYEEYLAHHAASPSDRLLGLGRVRLQEIQAALSQDEGLLTYLSSANRLDAFLVTRTHLAYRSSSTGSRDLAGRIRVTRELLIRGGSESPLRQSLGDLYRVLIGDFARTGSLQGVQRIVIVPHAALEAMPFAALWNQQASRFLVQDISIAYLPAVGALTVRQGPARNVMRGLIVFAPLPDSLPGTAREARAIARLVPGAELRVGRSSSESEVRRSLQSARPVHIASHGMHNAHNPLFSRITVGRSSDAKGGDGKLQVHEILRLTVSSPLVFLSGCETGLVASGQEPFTRKMEEGGLAQALLAAGAGTVVATLWRVEDQSAADLAQSFYRGLSTGAAPAEALAQAQRLQIQSNRNLDWAAYTVSGLSPVRAIPATMSVQQIPGS